MRANDFEVFDELVDKFQVCNACFAFEIQLLFT